MSEQGHSYFAPKLIEALGELGRASQLSTRRSWASPNDRDRHSVIVCSGLLALYRERASGHRRLVALRYPGEIVAPHEHGLGVSAMSPSEIVATSHESFLATIQDNSDLQLEFDRSVKRSQVIAYEWLMRDALDTASRVAHFLCEHSAKLGLQDDEEVPVDFTQSQLGEITAQTAVNINRVLGSFAKQGLLTPTGQRTFRPNWSELRRLGRFDASYLT